jgi:toxin YhaV
MAWPEFARQVDELAAAARRVTMADPAGHRHHPHVKLFAAVSKLVRDVIPADPAGPEFILGNTLGPRNRHWRRAKFNGRFQLFFRFHSGTRTIVYAWMNDENSLRKSGAKTDPYRIFQKMLESGRPPSDWSQLVDESAGLASSPREM